MRPMQDRDLVTTRSEPQLPVSSGKTDANRENLLQIVWRRRGVAIITLAACLAVAGAYLALTTRIYTSTARLYVAQIQPPIASENLRMDDDHAATYLQTQSEVIRSRPVVNEALRRAEKEAPLMTLAGAKNPLKQAQDLFKVQVGKRDNILTLTFESPYPAEAQRMLSRLVEAYLARYATEMQSATGKVLAILQDEKDKCNAEWNAKQKELLEFQRANGELSFENERGNVIVDRLARLSEALTAAQQRRIEAETAYRTASEAAKTPEGVRGLIELLQSQGNGYTADPEYAELQRQLHSLQIPLASLQQRLMQQHALVRGTQEAVAQLEAQIAEKQLRFALAYLSMLEQRQQQARQMESEIRAVFDDQQKQALSLNNKAVERIRIKADLARIEKSSDLLDARIKELSRVQQAGAMNIQVLENAYTDSKPTHPRKTVVLGAALAVGMLLSVVLALLRDWQDERFHSGRQIQESLDVAMLGMIPHMPSHLSLIECGQMVWREPMSPAAEAYRIVRTAVHFSHAGSQAKSILITSPLSGDGKTTLVSNLAIAMAQAGRRVLIIDADLRRPAQHLVFGLNPGAGLAGILEGRITLDQAIQSGGMEGLDLLPCGPVPHNPSKILNGQALAALLLELGNRYDDILVDSPPAASVSDARILAALCDTTILVLRRNLSPAGHALRPRRPSGRGGADAGRRHQRRHPPPRVHPVFLRISPQKRQRRPPGHETGRRPGTTPRNQWVAN